MRSRNSEIFYPENLLEAQNILKDYPDSRIIAGGTGYFFLKRTDALICLNLFFQQKSLPN